MKKEVLIFYFFITITTITAWRKSPTRVVIPIEVKGGVTGASSGFGHVWMCCEEIKKKIKIYKLKKLKNKSIIVSELTVLLTLLISKQMLTPLIINLISKKSFFLSITST